MELGSIVGKQSEELMNFVDKQKMNRYNRKEILIEKRWTNMSMFLDQVTIDVKAGNVGDGMVAFSRE